MRVCPFSHHHCHLKMSWIETWSGLSCWVPAWPVFSWVHPVVEVIWRSTKKSTSVKVSGQGTDRRIWLWLHRDWLLHISMGIINRQSQLDIHGSMHHDIITKITNKMQLCRLIYCSLLAQHVSSDIFACHREYLDCIYSIWYYSPMSLPASSDIGE